MSLNLHAEFDSYISMILYNVVKNTNIDMAHEQTFKLLNKDKKSWLLLSRC
jgi:hypothetical protein